MEGLELRGVVSAIVGVLLHFVLPFALFLWGRSIANRLPESGGWRAASYLPLLALLATLLGVAGTVVALVTSFSDVASIEARSRATALADGISAGMTATLVGLVVSIALYVISVVAFTVGEIRIRRARRPSAD